MRGARLPVMYAIKVFIVAH